jgi:hypothetical protein
MKSHLEIVKALHAKHVHEDHDPNKHWETCPFCDRIRCEFLERVYMYIDEQLLALLHEHADKWVQDGVHIGNNISGHRMMTTLSATILQDWLLIPKMVLEDTPEEYRDHPIVEELYYAQHK